ncbi:MAG: flagellar export protein FliJ [Desulfonatronovibrio sp. MSAO_Bac4]|nr:MAG: flagellar export protein FliJ [Desulfonatronovibrio sp. MSAO_Bac4]
MVSVAISRVGSMAFLTLFKASSMVTVFKYMFLFISMTGIPFVESMLCFKMTSFSNIIQKICERQMVMGMLLESGKNQTWLPIMRKIFNFNLQKILDFRTSLEEKSQQEFSRARKKYQEQTYILDNIKYEIDQAKKEIKDKKNITQGDIWLWDKYIERLNFDLKRAELRLRELARELSLKRQNLLEKSKDKKIIEKLKVNQKLKFDYEQEKEEQKEFDEMAVVRFKPKAF